MVYALSKLLFWPVLRLFVKDIKGLENLPNRPFILVANHSSYIDVVFMLFMVAWHKNRKLCTFATNEKFTGPIWSILFNHFGAIRVNGSVKKALKAYKQGSCIGLFPEGGRTLTGKVNKVTHSGLGVMALKTNALVVPVGLNTYKFWNRKQKIPNFKRNIKITIGHPKRFTYKLTKPNVRKVTTVIMKEVKRLARISHT